MPSLADPPRWALPTPESASGCFETMRAYQGRIFRLQGHLERLYASAQYLGVRIPDGPQQMGQRLRAALADSGIREAVVRAVLIPDTDVLASRMSRRAGRGRPDVRRPASPSIVVQPVQPPPPALYAKGIHVTIVPTRKFPVSQIDPHAKFSARMGSVLATLEAQLRGADEALFLDELGGVTESTASNVGVIARGAFCAPPCSLGLLSGVTWQALAELADALKIPYREASLTRHELYNADEVFLTSTIKEVLPVTKVDGRRIGTGKPGPYTKQIHQAFRRLVRRELQLGRSG